MPSFAVLGATSWGFTLASLLTKNGHDVTVLVRSKPEAEQLAAARGVPRLPELRLPDAIDIRPASDPPSADGLVVAAPAQAVAASAAGLPALRDVPVLSAAKGIEHGTLRRMSEVLAAAGWPEQHIAVLSGPNLAHEIVRGLPAAAVVASRESAVATAWQNALSSPVFRVYRSDDVIGTELGGALKNIIAIAAGAAAGLGLGANAISALMTRGLAEMTRLGAALGARPLTFQGLAGVGDLAVTCYSPLSRNRRFGELLAGRATPAAAAAAIGETVEGAATAPVALELARRAGVDMPITEQVVAVLSEKLSVADAMAALLQRAPTSEH
ncbi:MAG: NAD(P)H-dependent glycerol-3-phosphate dehydrogenase [Hyphomicrobiales bacterium]